MEDRIIGVGPYKSEAMLEEENPVASSHNHN